MIDWNDIPYFLAVAEKGSLLRAAESLSVNHSTVFRRINNLEDKLGIRLFDRLPDGYSLTQAGESVLEHARIAENSIHSFERTVVGKDYQLSGEIRITAPLSLAVKVLAPCVAKFRAKHEGIKIDIIVSDTEHDLSRREADLALRATTSPPEYLVGRKVCELKWHVYSSKSYITKNGQPKKMDDLVNHKLVGADETLQRVDAYKWFTKSYPSKNFVTTASDMSTISSLCAEGLGVTLLPSDYSDHNLLRLFKTEPGFYAELWILTHPDLRNVARIKMFSNFLYDYLKKQKFK